MNRTFLSSIFILIGCSLLIPISVGQNIAQPNHTIETRGQTWAHLLIQVCIISQENQSWWKPEYLDAAIQGVALWNDAIQEFSSDYFEFRYLSNLSLVPTALDEAVSGFDIYIGWIEECELEATIGQTNLFVKSSCSIINSTICLAAKSPSGHIMTEVDMQNIVVHELGHNFGLSHCSYSEDVMYAVVEYRKNVNPLSTLNVYAVSQNFGWMKNSLQFSFTSLCPEPSSLILPSNIPYSYLSIAEENNPYYIPQSFMEKTVELLLRPTVLIALFIGLMAIFVTTIIVRKRKKSNNYF